MAVCFLKLTQYFFIIFIWSKRKRLYYWSGNIFDNIFIFDNISVIIAFVTLYCICVFSPPNELFIFVSTCCSLVKVTSYCLNPNLVLNLCTAVVFQFIIILVVTSLYTKILSDCFFDSPNLIIYISVFYKLKYILL